MSVTRHPLETAALSSWPVTLCVVWLALGCAPGEIGGSGEAPETSESGSEESGSEETGSEETGSEETTGEEPQPEPATACLEAGELLPAHARIDRQAATLTVYELEAEPLVLAVPFGEGNAGGTIRVVHSQAHIVVATAGGSVPEPLTHLRLFARGSDELLWEHSVDDSLWSVHVDALGRVTAGPHSWVQVAGESGWLIVDGEAALLPNFIPLGPIRADGWIPGNHAIEGDYVAGFYAPASGETIAAPAGAAARWSPDRHSIEYLELGGPTPLLRVVGPELDRTIELAPFAGLEGVVGFGAMNGRYRLLELHDEDYVLEAVLRLDLDSEQLIPINFVPPPGLEHFDCYGRQFGVDAQGRILSALRDAGSAQLHTWDPLADTWGTLGEAVTGVQSLVAAPGSWGSLHAIRSEGWDYPYCEQDANWSDPPAEALAGTRIQLARSDAPVEVVLYVPDHEFATDIDVDVEATAGCVAFWSPGLGETLIRDLDDGEELALDERLVWLSE